MNELNKIKDYILKLAKEKGSINYSDYSVEDARIWKHLVLQVKDDGYIKCTLLTSAIWLDLSAKGELFMLQGGYSSMPHEQTKMKAAQFMEMLVSEAAKQGISTLFGRLE